MRDDRRQTTDTRQQMRDNREQTTENRQQTTDRRQETGDRRQETGDRYGLEAKDNRRLWSEIRHQASALSYQAFGIGHRESCIFLNWSF